MKTTLIIISLLFLQACAAPNPLYLKHETKADKSKEYYSDKTQCSLYANASAPIQKLPGNIIGRNQARWAKTFYECMLGKGWYAIDKNGNEIA